MVDGHVTYLRVTRAGAVPLSTVPFSIRVFRKWSKCQCGQWSKFLMSAVSNLRNNMRVERECNSSKSFPVSLSCSSVISLNKLAALFEAHVHIQLKLQEQADEASIIKNFSTKVIFFNLSPVFFRTLIILVTSRLPDENLISWTREKGKRMTMKSKAKTASKAKTPSTPKAKAAKKAPPAAPKAPIATPVLVKKAVTKKNHVLPPGFDLKQASTAVSTLISHIRKTRQNTLFEDAPVRINLDVVAFKIPNGSGHFTSINLPHSPFPTDAEILFVIPDGKKGEAEPTEPEHLVNRMKDKLREFNITNIREVMTVKQLKSDFSTYEAKRELAKRIDVVIGMKSIITLLPPILGREFYKKKKVPLELKLQEEDQWDEVFEMALKKTVFNISLNGNTSTLLVGHTNLTAAELTENISKIVNWFMRLYPGGWENVSQLSLHSNGVPPLQIYFGAGSRNDVPRACTRGRKVAEPVVGELSTMPGRRVKIQPYGEIEVSKDSDQSDDEVEDDIHDIGDGAIESPVEDEEDKADSKSKGKKKKAKKSKDDMDDAERKYVEAVFKRQEFEESQKKLKKRESPSNSESNKSAPAKKKRKSKAN